MSKNMNFDNESGYYNVRWIHDHLATCREPGFEHLTDIDTKDDIITFQDMCNGMKYVTFRFKIHGDTVQFWSIDKVLYEVEGVKRGLTTLRFKKKMKWFAERRNNPSYSFRKMMTITKTCNGVKHIYKLR